MIIHYDPKNKKDKDKKLKPKITLKKVFHGYKKAEPPKKKNKKKNKSKY